MMIMLGGTPLADNLQDHTPLQYAFLEEALPRIEARRNGVDPDAPEGAKSGGGANKAPLSGKRTERDASGGVKPYSTGDLMKQKRKEAGKP